MVGKKQLVVKYPNETFVFDLDLTSYKDEKKFYKAYLKFIDAMNCEIDGAGLVNVAHYFITEEKFVSNKKVLGVWLLDTPKVVKASKPKNKKILLEVNKDESNT